MNSSTPFLLKKLLLIIYLLPFLVVFDGMAQSNELKSPDGRLSIIFETIADKQVSEEGGQLVYSATFQTQALIDRSALSLEFPGQIPLGEDGQK